MVNKKKSVTGNCLHMERS